MEQSTGIVDATSGAKYHPQKIRDFQATILHDLDVKDANETLLAQSCERWIVTTTINPATPNLQAIASVSGWCKVFVLDKKSPKDFALSGPGVVVLTVADQEALTWRVTRLIPWNHFGRKNLGYVYALLHGAQLIYDTDDDNIIEKSPSGDILLPESLAFADGSSELHLAPVTDDGAFNPYPFWGALNGWPRGFPLSLVNTITARSGVVRAPDTWTVMNDGQKICAMQSLANADPDVDAIYRLTQPLPLFFPVLGARLLFPAGVYVPANAQALLMNREVAAAALLPVTVHGRVSDIWRSYIMQRVMWDSGCRLSFADPWVKQYRNAHGYQRDFHAELDLYLKTEGLLQVLDEIDFGAQTALGPRVLTTFMKLYEFGLLEELDVKLAYAYLRDLSLVEPVSAWEGGAPTAPGGAALILGSAAPVPLPQASCNRAVVCLAGIFRGGPFTVPLLKSNVLDALDMPFDVVVVTPDLPEDNVADFLYFLPSLRAIVHPNYDNVSALAGLDWSRTALSHDYEHNPSKWISQLTDLSACNDAIRQANTTYTHMVRVRADALVLDRLPVPLTALPPKHIVVPENEKFRGVNDRFAYGRIEDMSVLYGLLQHLPELIRRAPVRLRRGSRWNAEVMFATHGEDNGIVFVGQPIQLCRFRTFRSGVLTMAEHDAETFERCSEYCKSLRGCRW